MWDNIISRRKSTGTGVRKVTILTFIMRYWKKCIFLNHSPYNYKIRIILLCYQGHRIINWHNACESNENLIIKNVLFPLSQTLTKHNFELRKQQVTNYNSNNTEFFEFQEYCIRTWSTHTFWFKLNIMWPKKGQETRDKKQTDVISQDFGTSKLKCWRKQDASNRKVEK